MMIKFINHVAIKLPNNEIVHAVVRNVKTSANFQSQNKMMDQSLSHEDLTKISTIRRKTTQFRFDLEKRKYISIRKNSLDDNVIISIEENPFMKWAENLERSENKAQSTQIKPKLLINAYSDTTIVPEEQLSEIKGSLDNFTKLIWLPVKLPFDDFNYTTTILGNKPFQGLFYLLIYNFELWSRWIPRIGKIALNKLEPILDVLEKVDNVENGEETNAAINELCDLIERLDNETFVVVQSALFDIQLQIYRFIQDGVTKGQFSGKEVSYRNYGELYFKIPGQDDDSQVLCLRLSKEDYPPVIEFSASENDNRLVRIIKFAYLTDMEEYEVYENYLGYEERVQILQDHKEQISDSKTFLESYPHIPIMTERALINLKNFNMSTSSLFKSTHRLYRFYTKCMEFQIKMPKEFGYTCMIRSKRIQVGLLHSVARHSDQWAEHIDGFDGVMSKLELIRPQLDKIRECGDNDDEAKKAAYKEYYEVYHKVKSNVDLELALLDAQIQVLQRIQSIVTNEQYSGDLVNDDGYTAAVFKVNNTAGEAKLMCLGTSSNLYPPIKEFSDKRPVRWITTVYFGTYELYQELDVITGKVWKSSDSRNGFDAWAKSRVSCNKIDLN